MFDASSKLGRTKVCNEDDLCPHCKEIKVLRKMLATAPAVIEGEIIDVT
jgi:hypothetical protein